MAKSVSFGSKELMTLMPFPEQNRTEQNIKTDFSLRDTQVLKLGANAHNSVAVKAHFFLVLAQNGRSFNKFSIFGIWLFSYQ